MDNQPIFIVGVQRSGTTLLAAMLAAHSRLSCGPETHFFRKLPSADAQRLCAADTWPQPAADFVASIRHTGFVSNESKTLLDKYQIDPSRIVAYLREQPPSIAQVLASVTVPYMEARKKQRWVEKTPDHLLCADAIRQHFPDSPIIRIVRDPRDVALSLMKVPWGAKTFVEGVFHWDRLDRGSRDFFASDRRSFTIRFEDLVSSPTETLKRVCDFIGEAFEPAMLDTSGTGSEINTRNVPWKSKVSQAVDASRVAAWKNELSPDENQLAEAFVGDRLVAFGYPREAAFGRLADLRADLDVAAQYAEGLRVLAMDGVRFWKTRFDEKPTVYVYVGEPGSQEWSAPRTGSAAVDALTVLASTARAAVRSDHSVYWLSNTDGGTWAGCVAFVLRAFLSPFKVRIKACDPPGLTRSQAG